MSVQTTYQTDYVTEDKKELLFFIPSALQYDFPVFCPIRIGSVQLQIKFEQDDANKIDWR